MDRDFWERVAAEMALRLPGTDWCVRPYYEDKHTFKDVQLWHRRLWVRLCAGGLLMDWGIQANTRTRFFATSDAPTVDEVCNLTQIAYWLYFQEKSNE